MGKMTRAREALRRALGKTLGPVLSKVRAAFVTAGLVGAAAAVGALADTDLGFLGPWAPLVGAAMVAGVAWLKRETRMGDYMGPEAPTPPAGGGR